MFAALVPPAPRGDSELAAEAEELAENLRRWGFPVRHAGSFGFDFVALEAFFDALTERWVLRVAAADLPTALFAEIAERVASWWNGRWRSRAA
jgi:hypothetical protein